MRDGVTRGDHIDGNADRRSVYMPGMKDTRRKEDLLVDSRETQFGLEFIW